MAIKAGHKKSVLILSVNVRKGVAKGNKVRRGGEESNNVKVTFRAGNSNAPFLIRVNVGNELEFGVAKELNSLEMTMAASVKEGELPSMTKIGAKGLDRMLNDFKKGVHRSMISFR